MGSASNRGIGFLQQRYNSTTNKNKIIKSVEYKFKGKNQYKYRISKQFLQKYKTSNIYELIYKILLKVGGNNYLNNTHNRQNEYFEKTVI